MSMALEILPSDQFLILLQCYVVTCGTIFPHHCTSEVLTWPKAKPYSNGVENSATQQN